MYVIKFFLLIFTLTFTTQFSQAVFYEGNTTIASTTHTGFITCPSNETIVDFRLVFSANDVVRRNNGYSMYIDNNLIYVGSTSTSTAHGSFNQVLPNAPTMSVPCNQIAIWKVVANNPAITLQLRYAGNSLNGTINVGSNRFVPTISTTSLDRLAFYNLSTTSIAIPGQILRFDVINTSSSDSIILNANILNMNSTTTCTDTPPYVCTTESKQYDVLNITSDDLIFSLALIVFFLAFIFISFIFNPFKK